jgi:hypothetical protein
MATRKLSKSSIKNTNKSSNAWDSNTTIANGMSLIAEQVYTSTGTGQIVFSNIPQTYSHLYMLSKLRDGDTSNTDIAFTNIYFNGNTTANRETNFTYGINTNATTSNKYQNQGFGCAIQRGNGPSGVFAVSITHIPFYSVSSREKHFHWETGATGTASYGFLGFGVTYNATTDPITQIAIDQGNVNWAVGSMVQLYGVK